MMLMSSHDFKRVLAIYKNMLGWKTYEYREETDELPNPGPTRTQGKSG